MMPELKLVENTGSELEPDTFELPPQQAEMPFAIVDGEPVTEMPKDLYIPPDALQVFLEAFEGPLDLLLYLIRRQNLDILDIPIAEITKQYMKYIEVMAELQLELAGEYLLMAAMLAEIKSRMLLPRPPSAEGQEEEDPRAELVRRLQEYERFKKAAEDLDQLPRLERDTMTTSVELVERKVVKMPPQVTLQEMLLAFKDVLSRAEMFAHHHIHREPLSIRQRMSDILSTLRESAFLDFARLFKAEEGRMGVTVTFIAILQLMKDGLIEIVQAEPYAPIHVRPHAGSRHLTVVSDNAEVAAADAENEAALAQPAHPDEDEDDADEVLEFAEDADDAAASAESATDEAPNAESVADETANIEGAANETANVESATDETPNAEGLSDAAVVEDRVAIDELTSDEAPSDESESGESAIDERVSDAAAATDQAATDQAEIDEAAIIEAAVDETAIDETASVETEHADAADAGAAGDEKAAAANMDIATAAADDGAVMPQEVLTAPASEATASAQPEPEAIADAAAAVAANEVSAEPAVDDEESSAEAEDEESSTDDRVTRAIEGDDNTGRGQ